MKLVMIGTKREHRPRKVKPWQDQLKRFINLGASAEKTAEAMTNFKKEIEKDDPES
jgi:hypothetical protein